MTICFLNNRSWKEKKARKRCPKKIILMKRFRGKFGSYIQKPKWLKIYFFDAAMGSSLNLNKGKFFFL